jgi:hypothetical protein
MQELQPQDPEVVRERTNVEGEATDHRDSRHSNDATAFSALPGKRSSQATLAPRRYTAKARAMPPIRSASMIAYVTRTASAQPPVRAWWHDRRNEPHVASYAVVFLRNSVTA